MVVRKLDKKEHQKTRKLYEEVFTEDSTSFVDYYYTEKTKDNQIYVVEEDDDICAMLHLNPYTLLVNGSEKQVNYIVAVATREQYRKRGYMKALLTCALHDMYDAGESFTFLMPASEAIYLPHGFRTVYEQNIRYFVSEEAEEGTEVHALREEECAELAAWANQKLAQNFQVYARRDACYYERLIKECKSDAGNLMIYRKNQEITDCRLLYPNEEEEKTEKPKIMIRIVDVRRMLMSLRLKSFMGTCFSITDELIEENNRCVVITGTEFSGVMLMEGKPENSEGTITIDALSSFIFGAKSVEEISREEGVEMTERMQEEMKKIMPLSRIYLNETV